MATMEPIVKKWYDALKEGKILGLKCKDCGAIEFPPVPVCNICSGTNMEWVEMSGEGELITFCFSPMGVYPYSTDPALTGFARLKEGMLFASVFVDASGSDQSVLMERLKKGPVPIKLEIKQLDENISFPNFRLKE
jgi:uncharacterized OB-fold protein